MIQKIKRIPAGMLIFCLVLLANPNVNVIDIFPDFIAWFLLAKLFSPPSDVAPYFSEAKATFMKLGWITLAKIPVSFIALGSGFGDQTALFALVFAVAELIFTMSAVYYTFEALFYLGSRTDATALIAPYGKKRRTSPEALRAFTYFFFTVKALCSTLPEFLLLTGEENSSATSLGRGFYYPRFLLLAIGITFILGIIFLVRITRYIKVNRDAGGFSEALAGLIREEERPSYERKIKCKRIATALNILSASAVFCIDFSADTFGGINILPQFIFGIIFFFGVFTFRSYLKGSRVLLLLCGGLIGVSLFSHIASIYFYQTYTQDMLLFHDGAIAAYSLCELGAVLEGALFLLLMLATVLSLSRFIKENTGVLTTDAAYSLTDRSYHKALLRRGLVLFTLSVLHAVARVVLVFLEGAPKFISTGDYESESEALIIAPALDWFGVVVTVLAVLFILYAFYFFGTLKDEVKMKLDEAA